MRLGDMLSAGVVFAATLLLGGEDAVVKSTLAPRLLAGLNLALVAVWIALAIDLARRYRNLAGETRAGSGATERAS